MKRFALLLLIGCILNIPRCLQSSDGEKRMEYCVIWTVLSYDPETMKIVSRYTKEMEFRDKPAAKNFVDHAPTEPFDCYDNTRKCRSVKFRVKKARFKL